MQKIIWSCIVEDPALFLRHFLEKLTNRERQASLLSHFILIILFKKRKSAHLSFSYDSFFHLLLHRTEIVSLFLFKMKKE